MTSAIQNELQQEISQTETADLLHEYGILSALNSTTGNEESISAIFEQYGAPEMNSYEDLDYVIRTLFVPELSTRGVTQQEMDASTDNAFNELAGAQNKEEAVSRTSSQKLLKVVLTLVGAGIIGFVIGPMVAKKHFPNNKGSIVFVFALIGGGIGYLAAHMILNAQMNRIAKTMVDNTGK